MSGSDIPKTSSIPRDSVIPPHNITHSSAMSGSDFPTPNISVPIETLLSTYGSPLYVYDLDFIRSRATKLKDSFQYNPLHLLFAIKANSNPAVARVLIEEGLGIDAVSPGEVALALRLGLDPSDILYTENNMTTKEMQHAVEQGVLINCGSLDRLESLAQSGCKRAAVRFNPRVGDSEHAHTLTAGPLTKFGVHHTMVDEVLRIEREYGIHVVGCHMHIGSGSNNADAFVQAMGVILGIAKQLPNLEFIDFGGGLGVPMRPHQVGMDLAELGTQATAMMEQFSQEYGRRIELRLEPGRFLSAEAGTLFTTVTSTKINPACDGAMQRSFIGTDTGFNHLLRPCLYGSYHHISNVSNPTGPSELVDIVGNICESGDILGRDRQLAEARVGDILAIHNCGAYGFSMASTYNLRPLPAEVAIEGGRVRLTRKRVEIEDLLDQWEWNTDTSKESQSRI